MTRTQVYHATTSTTVQPQKPPVESPTDELGGQQTISPRTELLSPSTDNHRSHHTSSKRKHKKHRSSRSHDQSTTSDASQRELLRIVLEQEAEADNLKKALRTTLERLDEETRKVAEYEKGNREAAEKLRAITESRAAAEQEATRATQQLHVYEFQLQNAQKEIRTTQETLKLLETQKQEAEDLAARARARARKLLQKQMVFQAKEEGRRMGFEAGVRQAEEELAISTTARRALARTTVPTHSNPRRQECQHRAEERTPPPQSPVEELQEDNSPPDDDPLDDSGPPAAEQTGFTDGDSSTLRTPIFPPLPLYPPNNPMPPQPPAQQPDPNRSPNVQVYSVAIPPAEEIQDPSHRRSGWVTAQQHRDVHGSETATPPIHANQGFVAQNAEQSHFGVPIARPRSRGPPPAPIFPVNVPVMQPQTVYNQTPPKSATSSRMKMLRFPSLKDKAQSWYRSFSLRRRNKPVIDPIEEEPSEQQPHQNGHINGGANPEQQMYNYQPEPPQSWYHEPRRSEDARSQKSRVDKAKGHSRSASMDDRLGGDRASIASTRLSQLGLVSPPAVSQGPGKPGSVSGRSGHTTNAKQSAHKLSIINESSRRRFTSPLAEVLSTGTRTSSVPFAFPPRSDAGRSKKRPPDISVPPPDGFSADDPFVQGNFHVIPAGGLAPPLAAKSSGVTSSTGSGPIDISVQPATAAVFNNLPTSAPPDSGNHLTPHYVYRPPTMTNRSPQRSGADLGWEPTMPSNASRRSGHSTQSKPHRQTQSFGAQPQGYADNQSMRSSHSRAASGANQGHDTRRTSTSRYSAQAPTVPNNTYLTASPRATGVHSPNGSGNPQAPQDGHAIHRVSSRGSMLSTHDPNTYIDPAFFAPDGSADPNFLHVNNAASPNMLNRGLSRTPSLEYIDP